MDESMKVCTCDHIEENHFIKTGHCNVILCKCREFKLAAEYKNDFVLTPPPIKPRFVVPKRTKRRGRWHYHVLICPHCGKATMSDKRLRHTYVVMRNWLRRNFGLQRFYAKRLAKQLLVHKNDPTWQSVNQRKESQNGEDNSRN